MSLEDKMPESSSSSDMNRCTSTGSNISLKKPSSTSMRETTIDSAMSSNTYGSYEYNYDDDDDDDDYEYNDDDNDDDEVGNGKDENGMDFSISNLPKPKSTGEREVTMRDISDGGYRMWSMDKIKTTMKRTVNKVVEVLGVSTSAAAVLLRKFKWDEKKLVAQYFDNQEKILEQCGLVARCGDGGEEAKEETKSEPTKTCMICFEDFDESSEEMYGMACGHEFCCECWSGYLEEAVSNGPKCVFTTCPHPKCKEVVTEEEVGEVAKDVLTKFQNYQLRSYVETSWRMRWCPGPSCDLVAVASTVGLSGEGICKCETKFCLRCGEVVHSPATCDMLTQWTEKCQDESETTNWILSNTKKCPKCKTHIEKNQGCNHMTCTQCNYHFCWMCMRDWNVHGYNSNCNKFDVDKANEKNWKKDQAEQELDRYLHCFTRYQAHSEAMDFAVEQLKKFNETGTYATTIKSAAIKPDNDDIKDSGGSNGDGLEGIAEEDPELATALRDSLEDERKRQKINPTSTTAAFYRSAGELSVDQKTWKEAQTQIIECRRILKYTYIVSYYLKDKSKRALHEDHQAQLQHYTEMLSEQCEKPFDEIDFGQVYNLKNVVADYAKNIVELDLLDDDFMVSDNTLEATSGDKNVWAK